MPYRVNPKNPKEVQVKKNGRWVHSSNHASAAKAKAAAAKKNMVVHK